jgi:PAS domain S-box-containing protein
MKSAQHDAEGRADRAVGVMPDASAGRQAEVTLRLQSAALNAAANPIVITDRAGVIIWANPAFTELSGYTIDETAGRNPRDLVKSGVHSAEFYREMWDTILAGRVWRGEMTNRRKDGSHYPEELTITPVHNESGEITHFIAIKRDLSNEKTLQSQFLQSQKMESVGRLAGGVAHDFNNLLTVINGTVDLALTALSPNDPLHADLREIQGAGERATALTRQLLAFSRQQVMRPQVLSLNGLIMDLLKMLGRLIGEDVELITDLAEDLGPVMADSGQLEQVIVNLTVNARDAMPRGGTLTFVTRNVVLNEALAAGDGGLPPGSYVSLSVHDTGAGMDEATRARIFEPFYTTKEPGKGTGLGLSTVYGIVTQSGGSIVVDSAPGRGTTFLVYLARVATPAVERRHAKPPAALAVGTETVLIVDDEAALRSVAARILSRHGYQVLTAANGGEAILLLERHEGPIDLLLSDVVMPGMSGPQLGERLQQRCPGLKLLFTSGYTDDVAFRHGLGGDRVQFIGKPYSIVDLTRKVREVLDAGRREDRA